MSDESQQEAAEHARRAAKEMKAAAEPVIEAVAAEVKDNTQKLEDTAHDAARTVRRLNPSVLSNMSIDVAFGFGAVAFSIYSGAVAVNFFRQAANRRRFIMMQRPSGN